MPRPVLNALSFLKHLFAPKKNPLPTGIRARKLTGTKGRKASRLAAYNRMSGKSQEILRMSGMREDYLKGEKSLSDAKTVLRDRALVKGVTRPSAKDLERIESRKKKEGFDKHVSLAAWTLAKVNQKLRDYGKNPKPEKMLRRLAALDDASLQAVAKMEVEEIRRYASDEDNIIRLPDGTYFNPLWYN